MLTPLRQLRLTARERRVKRLMKEGPVEQVGGKISTLTYPCTRPVRVRPVRILLEKLNVRELWAVPPHIDLTAT